MVGNKRKWVLPRSKRLPYPAILKIGDDQRMVFCEEDERPFYLSDNHCKDRKHDKPKGIEEDCYKDGKRIEKRVVIKRPFRERVLQERGVGTDGWKI